MLLSSSAPLPPPALQEFSPWELLLVVKPPSALLLSMAALLAVSLSSLMEPANMSVVSALLEPTLLLVDPAQHAQAAMLPPLSEASQPTVLPALLEPSPLLDPLIAVLVNLECELSLFKLRSSLSLLLDKL